MKQLASELNSLLSGTVAFRLMSSMGKRFYFPKGIIAQSAEAKKSAYMANASIGMAFSKGRPLVLSAIAESMPFLTPEQSVTYAPTAGVEELRNEWKNLILQKNSSLKPEDFSLPVAVPGLTAGLSYIADMFLPDSCVMITSDPCWDNYSLIVEERRAAELKAVPFFGGGNSAGLDLEVIGAAVRKEAEKGAVRIVLNFPNNPSGYSPTVSEAEALAKMLLEAAERGADVLAVCDDAYFGFFYEDDVYRESMFSLLAGLHERVLAVKIDGPIKEDYVWGLRTGFVSFGCKGYSREKYDALNSKFMGAVRSSVSCANTPAQYFVLRAIKDERTPVEKLQFQKLLQTRYNAVKAFLAAQPAHPALLPLPFNSGYFMSFRCPLVSAEVLRRELLQKHGIGVVSLGDNCLRVAFSSLEHDQIVPVFQKIYEAASGLV